MRFVKRGVVVLAVIASLVVTGSAQAQTKSDKDKEARDLIRRARTLLGDFVNENPKSARFSLMNINQNPPDK